MDNRPIGVFDSGLGGLTGVRELRKRLPHEEIIYFGDTGRVPYGSRSPETILQYTRQDVAFLLSKDVKCIMAACGTVSSTYPAAEAARLLVPYLGVVDAAAREAAFSTRNRRIGVIGTAATIRSRSYEKLLRQLVPGVEITARACPLFVPLVEAGYVDHSEESRQQVTKLVIAQYLTEVRDAGVDTLILGCTHYPLLKTMIGEFMGRKVTLVDPAKTAAHHLERMLSERGLKAAQEHEGQAHFYVSDVPDSFVQTADLFLGEYKGGPVQKGGSYYITYKETETTGYEGCTTTLKIAADGSRVAMLRFGKGSGAGTQLLIEKGKRNLCHYETGYGSMTLGVTADEIICSLTEKGGTAKFGYLLDANSAELVSRNRLEVTVTHVN